MMMIAISGGTSRIKLFECERVFSAAAGYVCRGFHSAIYIAFHHPSPWGPSVIYPFHNYKIDGNKFPCP